MASELKKRSLDEAEEKLASLLGIKAVKKVKQPPITNSTIPRCPIARYNHLEFFKKDFVLPVDVEVEIDHSTMSEEEMATQLALNLPRIASTTMLAYSGYVFCCDWQIKSKDDLEMYLHAIKNLKVAIEYSLRNCKDWLSVQATKLANVLLERVNQRLQELHEIERMGTF